MNELGTDIPPIVNEVLNAPGQPLDTATRAFMEPRFHHDFSQVRVHTDARAAESARTVNAHAYTVGSHIVFNTGQYLPGTKIGNNLLAHELTHVLQQSQGLTRSALSGVGPADDEFERQADAVAHAIVDTPAKPVSSSVPPLIPGTQQTVARGDAPPPPPSRTRLQRKEDDLFENFSDEEIAQAGGGETTQTAACPKVPTKRGDDIPVPLCPTATHTGANELRRFNFCLDSDQLTNGDQLGEVDTAVNSVPPSSRFLIHGYASPEGRKDYNFRLACHRALKIAAAVRASLRNRLTAPNKRMLDAEVESRIETASQGPTAEFGKPEANRIAIMFAQVPGRDAEEPGCDKAPRKLGDIKPDINCDVARTEVDNTGDNPQLARFHFCLDSDVLTEESPGDIRSFAHRQASSATFIVHGFASVEGAPDYNQRLSCHRATRIFRELINAGVQAEQITEVSGKGETDLFGEPKKNRVAVVFAQDGEVEPIPGGTRNARNIAEKEAIRDEARARLLSGKYNLGADAYISFWTCGRTATVRQAVERLMIGVAQDNDDNALREQANGTEEGFGINSVTLSNVALRSDNAIECVMARIVDMSFHHSVLGNPDLPSDLITPFNPRAREDELKNPANKDARHQAGLHLIHLAGLGACEGDQARPRKFGKDDAGIDQPRTDDPRKKMDPPVCAVAPQQTRLHPPAEGAKDREAPTFNVVTPLKFTPVRGKLITNFDDFPDRKRSQVRLLTRPEKGIFIAKAEVQLEGNPDTFRDYEVGLIQTIVSDEGQADYDSGHSVIQKLPAPIRLAHMRGFPMVAPPWTMSHGMKRPGPDGNVKLHVTGSGLNTESEIGLRQVNPLLPRSAIHQFEQGTHISLWLVARRLGAPLDRFTVRFLDGVGYDLLQQYHLEHRRQRGEIRQPVEPGLEEKEVPIVLGSFLTSKETLPSDTALARFTSPVASEIPLRNQIHQISEPRKPRRTDLTQKQLERVVQEILDDLVVFEGAADAKSGSNPIKMPRLGFDFIKLKIILPIVRATGRLQNMDDEKIAVRVEKREGLGGDAAKALAEALDFRIRDRSADGRDVIVNPDHIPGDGPIGEVEVNLDPRKPGANEQLAESDLGKRSEVINDMAEAWACTLFTRQRVREFFGAREFGRSYAMDRNRGLHPAPSDRFVMGEESVGEGHKLNMVCPRPSDGVTMGGFHTHPDVQIPPVPSDDEDEGDDLDFARECGTQAFIVTDFKAFRYFADGRVDPNPIQLPRVNKCDAKHLQDNNVVDPTKPRDPLDE